MKTILAYGDSITWGSNPAAGGARHARTDRWPNVLAAGLSGEAEIVVDAMRGRTTGYDENLADCDRNGARLLPSALYSHAPLDLVILMLGTNDLKPAIAGTAVAAMQGMRRCAEIVRQHAPRLPGVKPPKLMIVAPPHMAGTADPFYADLFATGGPQSQKIAGYYKILAVEFDCAFFDAATVAKASPIDGVHLDAANTRAIGAALVAPVRALLAE
jgi:lysophospholipase L1-like esterase